MGSVGGVTATVRDLPTESRFEIHDGDTLAGYAEYLLDHGEMTLTHTVVDDDLEGRGLGTQLVAAALSEARERGLHVVPQCPFVTRYVRDHPEWLDLVPEDRRTEFGL